MKNKPPTPETTPAYPRWPFSEVVVLTPHPGSGKWKKKHRGHTYYFGRLDDPRGALAEWRETWPGIAGVAPDAAVVAATGRRPSFSVYQLFLAYLENREAAMKAGDIVFPTFQKYRYTLKTTQAKLGKRTQVHALTPADFGKLIEQSWSPMRRADYIATVKAAFNWGAEARLIETVFFGPDFKRPPLKAMRRQRREAGDRTFTRQQIHAMLGAASVNLNAAIMLGINGAFGNTDAASLAVAAVDFKKKLIDYGRVKTEVARVVPLWPETIAAIKAAMKPGAALVLTTDTGLPLVRPGTDEICTGMRELLKPLGITGGFYDLRRTFATVAAEQIDRDARKLIMGHETEEAHDVYIQRFPLKRLLDVSNHVRSWLYAKDQSGSARRGKARRGRVVSSSAGA